MGIVSAIPKLNSAAFVRSLIADMLKTTSDKGMRLDMGCYAIPHAGVCRACAGGSVVIHGLGGERDSHKWGRDEWTVARWCNSLRIGEFWDCDYLGYPIPADVHDAWTEQMEDPLAFGFWEAWERFAEAWEAYEAQQAAGEGDRIADAMLEERAK